VVKVDGRSGRRRRGGGRFPISTFSYQISVPMSSDKGELLYFADDV
jgi:hypothetical protein